MSRTFELGDVIAESRLAFEVPGAPQTDVTVRIGRPVPDASALRETWVCPIQIDGIGNGRTRGIFGVDAMQALTLAIHTVPALLGLYIHESGGRFLKFGEPYADFIDACRIAVESTGDVFPPQA